MAMLKRVLSGVLALILLLVCVPVWTMPAAAVETEESFTEATEAAVETTSEATETSTGATAEATTEASEPSTEATAEATEPSIDPAVEPANTEPAQGTQPAVAPTEPVAVETTASTEPTIEVNTACEEVMDAAASDSCGASATWAFDQATGTLTISGSGEMAGYVDPSDAPWYSIRATIRKIVIQSGITGIGESAFDSCVNLTSVSIADSVSSIGIWAFYGCSSLTSVTIPDGVTSIGESTFYHCSSLTSVTIPSSVTSIGDWAFEGCSSLAGITIPDGVTSIGYAAFAECDSLTSITIPASVTSIGDYAFALCTKLTKIVFLGNAPRFVESAFNDSAKLQAFGGITATAYYPLGNTTWTESVMRNYGGNVTWTAWGDPAVPAKPYNIVNVVSGVHVYWRAVDGAVKYGVWRSESKDGAYKWLANPTVPHFTDTTAQSGKTYYYRVTAMGMDGKHSEKSEAIGIAFVSTPDITTRANIASGVQLGWNKIAGATGYAIYRKSYDGTDAWVRIGTIPGNETFAWTDKSVKNNNGQIYRYTIRALAGANMATLSGCRPAGRTMARLSSQVLTSVTATDVTSAKCTWTTSSRVTGYEVRFMVGDTVYKTFTIGNYRTGVKTFTGLPTGKTYTVQVRTYKKVDGVGSFYSDWSTAKTVTLT